MAMEQKTPQKKVTREIPQQMLKKKKKNTDF